MSSDTDRTHKQERWLSVFFLMILSYFTIVHNFWYPPNLFWDENYHIASAQKYLNGIYFMEPHPPLGKMFIALGEKITNMNAEDNQFIGTDYATNPPVGFSFFGYRLFPVLLAWFTVPVIFGIFLLLTKRTLWATLLSFLYVFDNALLVHMRSAMLESTMLFFGALTILAFLMAVQGKSDPKRLRNAALLFGVSFAGIMATKVFGLLLILFIPALLWLLWPNLRQWLKFVGWAALTFVIVYCGIWQLHYSIGSTVNPMLPDNGYYQASDQYKTILQNKTTSSPFNFFVMQRDSQKFVGHYERGVPRLDLCKPDENGSPYFLWPFGGRTINYRWETPDGFNYRYLYLVPNPVVWGIGLLGVILAVILLVGSWFFPHSEQKISSKYLLTTFLILYIGFMGAVSTIDRVMYLYHYFLPLILTFCLFALVFTEVQWFGKWKLTEHRKTIGLFGLAVVIFLSFELYRPFTYYEPLNDHAFQSRPALKVWELRCVHCDRSSPFVVPRNS